MYIVFDIIQLPSAVGRQRHAIARTIPSANLGTSRPDSPVLEAADYAMVCK